MTSQFPAPPAAATRLLVVLDAPMRSDVADDLAALVGTYEPTVVAAEAEVGVASRLARELSLPVELVPGLAAGASDEAMLMSVRAELVEHPAGCLVAVAREAAARALLCEALGVPPAVAWRFQVLAGAVSVIEVDGDGRWAVVRFNERGGPAART